MANLMAAHDLDRDGLPAPRRSFALATILLGVTLAVIDGTIANVALPTIAQDFNASAASSIWIVNAYQMAIVISLLPLAALGEILGYRRVYLGGVALFTIASLGCVLAPNVMALTIARAVQGFGAAGLMSVNGALLRYAVPKDRFGRALTALAAGPPFGPAWRFPLGDEWSNQSFDPWSKFDHGSNGFDHWSNGFDH